MHAMGPVAPIFPLHVGAASSFSLTLVLVFCLMVVLVFRLLYYIFSVAFVHNSKR